MDFPYPVAPRALKKWRNTLLRHEPGEGGTEHFTFTYHGSTCNNGGTPFIALMHVLLGGQGTADTAIIEKAWIEIPDDQKEAASLMCASPGPSADLAFSFFERLAADADFIGQSLESVILREVPENFAGCFCGRPHINQKWKIALSTVHFALSE